MAELLVQLAEEDELALHGDTDDMSYVDESEGLDAVRSSKTKTGIKKLPRRLVQSNSEDTEGEPDLHRTETKLTQDTPRQ
jgi:hypothetical protein